MVAYVCADVSESIPRLQPPFNAMAEIRFPNAKVIDKFSNDVAGINQQTGVENCIRLDGRFQPPDVAGDGIPKNLSPKIGGRIANTCPNARNDEPAHHAFDPHCQTLDEVMLR